MNTQCEIIFNKINIIDNQISYDTQEGGYEEINYSKVIDLWQNPDYNETFINFYSLVNKYLRGTKIEVKSEWLTALKLQSTKDFYDFLTYYINKLTNIIYKNVSSEKKIFYRGEARKIFNYKVGDILFFSTFQSVTTSISTAYKFSESVTDTKLLFVIEIPKGFHYKALHTKLKYYDYKEKITQIIDEKEYIIMPNSYYMILEKTKIYNNVNLIKLKLCQQKYYQITDSKLYDAENIILKNDNPNNFSTRELNKFMEKSFKYQQMINVLMSMKDYQINKKYYNELNDDESDNIFNLDMDLINKINEQITSYNTKEKLEEIKSLGLGYYDYHLKNISKYKKKIEAINIIINTDFKKIDNFAVYSGFYNIDSHFKKPKFIEFLKNKKTGEEFEYDKIIISHLEAGKFLYEDIYNNDYPHRKMKKGNNTKLVYYRYLIKLNLKNIKICVCSTHYFEYTNNVILIPKYKMTIIKKTKKYNRHDLPYILYEIDLVDA